MAYDYEDEDGYLAAGPSIGGGVALLDALNSNAPANLFPNLNLLIRGGECSSPEGVKGEAIRLAAKIKDKDVKDTLRRLAMAAAQAKGKITLS